MSFSRVIDQQVRDLGFSSLAVETPFDERGIFLSDEVTTALIARFDERTAPLANVFRMAPRMLVVLKQAAAALPDASFANRCGIDPGLIHLINTTMAVAEARPLPPLPDSGLFLYPAGARYAFVLFAAERLLALLVEARAVLPRAWEGHGEVPVEILAEIDATVAAARAPAATNARGV